MRVPYTTGIIAFWSTTFILLSKFEAGVSWDCFAKAEPIVVPNDKPINAALNLAAPAVPAAAPKKAPGKAKPAAKPTIPSVLPKPLLPCLP